MNLLLIGGGGREHALAWALAKSPRLGRLYAAPGNAGIAQLAHCADLTPADHGAVISFCRDKAIDLVVIGPEAPLVAGLADDLLAANIPVFGPTMAAARLEGSKAFTKALCAEHDIPTAAFARFDDAEAARAHVDTVGAPIVIKADGLAAGKGVTVAATVQEARAAIERLAGQGPLIVEECLIGEEASLFVLCDGERLLPLAGAQDHKRLGDGDTGPNTGGMGAYSPAPALTPTVIDQAMAKIVVPTVKALADKGTRYRGLLYAGLMLTAEGPKLLEYNCRFGDPETQAVLPRLRSDLAELLHATALGQLGERRLDWDPRAALTVVMASHGYPGGYDTGHEITGLDAAQATGALVFHAGTHVADGRIVTAGGRVLAVTALGDTIAAARSAAYYAVGKINWHQAMFRKDIGCKAR